jgi:transcriptional regulator with XRE-family HTH domain
MKPLTGKTLGKRIAQAWRAKFESRAEFLRALTAHSPALARLHYSSIDTWEKDKKTPRPAALQAIAAVTGYTFEQLYSQPAKAPEEADAGPLSDAQVVALLDSLGASAAIRAAVIKDLAAYPPRGGAHHEDVVRVHRLLTQRATVEQANDDADHRARELGGEPVEADDVRADVEAERASSEVTPKRKKKDLPA